MKEYEKINNISKNKKWIMCDYYDTLVRRDCHPNDIKMLWAAEMSEMLGYKISGKKILDIRNTAEMALSEKYGGLIKVGYNYNQLCAEIYDRLALLYESVVNEKYDNFENFTRISLDCETGIEKKHQILIRERCEFLKKMKARGKKIVLVSDFYIGREGFNVYVPEELKDILDCVYISCDYAARKDTGKLYDIVLSELKIDSKEAIMIGDNPISDKCIPESKGIEAVCIRTKGNMNQTDEKKVCDDLWSLMKNNQSYTYANYSFSLYYFIDGLYKYLVKNDIKTVLFCAREGEFLKELFDLYSEERRKIDSKYFYVSRLSTFVPSLQVINEEKFENLFRQYKDISPYSFMLSIGFESMKAEEICESINISSKTIITNFEESDVFQKLKCNQVFIDEYERIRNEQRLYFTKYIDSLCPNNSRICMVDVGWKGTIQDNIYNMYNGKRKIVGVYLGLSENMQRQKNNVKVGINFSSYPLISTNFNIWSYDKSFYEKLLYASHASTSGYNSDLTPRLESFAREKETYAYVRPLQCKIIDMFSQIDLIMKKSCYSVEDVKNIFTKIHLYQVCHIDSKHLKMQNKLVEEHFQNFGEFSWSQKKVVSQIAEIFKSNPKAIIKKILKDGFDIEYMYPGIKVAQKMKLNFLIPIYTRLVYRHMRRRI